MVRGFHPLFSPNCVRLLAAARKLLGGLLLLASGSVSFFKHRPRRLSSTRVPENARRHPLCLGRAPVPNVSDSPNPARVLFTFFPSATTAGIRFSRLIILAIESWNASAAINYRSGFSAWPRRVWTVVKLVWVIITNCSSPLAGHWLIRNYS